MIILIVEGCEYLTNNFINFTLNKYCECFIINLVSSYNFKYIDNIYETILESSRYKIIKTSDLSSYNFVNLFNTYIVDIIVYFSNMNKSCDNYFKYYDNENIGINKLFNSCKNNNHIKKIVYVFTKTNKTQTLEIELDTETVLALDTDTETVLALETESETIIALDTESESVIALDTETKKVIALDTETPLDTETTLESDVNLKIPIIIVNTHNIFGINQSNDEIISNFINRLKNNKKIIIQGDGLNIIPFLYIDDFVTGLDIVIQKGKIGDIYNICNTDNIQYTILDIAKILIKHIKKTEDYLVWITFIPNNCVNYNYCNDNKKITDLGWKINISFEENLFNLLKPFYINIPYNFQPDIYYEFNDDLKYLSYFDRIYHYETQGYHEDRIISLNLNYKVFVYCCGKSGSSTLYNTFIHNKINALHTHSNYYYSQYMTLYKYEPDLLKLIEKCSNSNDEIYIIDVYRTPIERKISSFFQHLPPDIHITYEELEKMLDNHIYEIENYISINEILDYFNLPYFTTFNFIKKYNLIKYKNINIIKLRFQDIHYWESILCKIFNRPICIKSDNLSENKSYNELYKKIKNNYKIPKSMVGYIKNHIESKIYLSETELNDYINYWSLRIK